MEVVLRAAAGTTSVNSVTTNTTETPNREPVIDWLHTLNKGSNSVWTATETQSRPQRLDTDFDHECIPTAAVL